MADPPPYPNTGDDTGARSRSGPAASRPRWMSVFWIIIVIALLALFLVLHLTGTLGPGAHG
jgi:hypothetical protein